MPLNVELSYPKKSENVRPHSNNSIENTTPLWSIQTHTTLHRTKGEPKVKRLKWLTSNFVRCQLRVIGLAVGKERWLSGVSGFAASDFTGFGRIPMFTLGKKVEIVSLVIRFYGII